MDKVKKEEVLNTDPQIAEYLARRKETPVPTGGSGKSFNPNQLITITKHMLDMVYCVTGNGKLPPQVLAMDRAFSVVIESGKATTLGNIATIWNSYPECKKQDFGTVWNHYSARLLGTAAWDKENGRLAYALSVAPKDNGRLALFQLAA
tara:strand:- start:33 stop:479 length:447 start_codon:yes stop_codon:yes gene_type:complete